LRVHGCGAGQGQGDEQGQRQALGQLGHEQVSGQGRTPGTLAGC